MPKENTTPGPVTQADLERGIELLNDYRHQIQEEGKLSLAKRRELEARIAVMEKQLPIIQNRLEETTACFGKVDKHLDAIIKQLKPEDAKVRGQKLIDDYKKYYDNPGLPCPVNKDTPLSSLAKPNEEQLASAAMHPEVKLSQAPTGAPLDTAIKAVREAVRTSGVRAAA